MQTSGVIAPPPPSSAYPNNSVRGVIDALFASGASFKEVRQAMWQRFGIVLSYNGADRVGGRAIARRRRQIDRGQLYAVRMCEKCRAILEPGRTVPLCSTCLEELWK